MKTKQIMWKKPTGVHKINFKYFDRSNVRRKYETAYQVLNMLLVIP